MRQTNLAGVDLNLLPALEALLRRRNVTRAAEDVGLSQPAMSRALQRLRDIIGDPLLVRGGAGLTPTPRALALLPELTAALDVLGALYRPPAFEPGAMSRVFSIAAADAQTVLLAPLILKRVRATAPGVDLRFEPYSESLRERIESGALDLAFATLATPLPPGAVNEPLADDRLALVVSSNHPWRDRVWTLEDYAAAAHVTISIRGDDDSENDALLARNGLARRIVLRTPHFLAALAAVGASEAVTTVSETLARRFAATFGLAVLESPLAAIPLQMSIVGAVARASDPGLVWLKGLIREVAQEVFQSSPGPGVAR